MSLRIKRVYDTPADDDGLRILVDRLWPRGLTKTRAAVALWAKDAAPSPKLRTWFGHDPKRLAEFARRYLRELQTNEAAFELRRLSKKESVTLLYGARDPEVNHAVVLASFLRARVHRTGAAVPAKLGAARITPKAGRER
jgi:uncharacterized protein YeaO (DUF488 family)